MKALNFILFLVPFISFSQNYEPTLNSGYEVNHTHYSLSYCEEHEQAEWVYYRLSNDMIQGSFGRTDDFRPDPSVTTGSAELIDYKGSGFDRGHLAPAADMKTSHTAMSESFYMSNMSPQAPSFNRGGWKNLESQIRNWVLTEGELFIATGPVFRDNLGAIGHNHVTIPGYFYKVVFAESNKKMIGFVMPNTKLIHNLQYYVLSVDSIESLTGIDFYHQLNDDLEFQLESFKQTNDWNFTSRNRVASNKNSKTTTSQQCIGQAKSTGSQCKNRTKESNGYCYIHQYQAPGYIKPKPVQSSGGRCKATTQAGTQCKRSAQSGRKYCWQHP